MKNTTCEESEEKKCVQISRFDMLIEDYVRTGNFSTIQQLNTEYPQEMKILIENVLNLGKVNDSDINEKLRRFYRDTTVLKLINDVKKEFSNLDKYNKELSKAFNALHKADSSIQIPKIYAQVSALNQSIIVDDSLIGISLDKYLGSNYPIYSKYYFEDQRASMRQQRIVPDCITFYLLSEFQLPNLSKATLLEHMIHIGKIYWITAEVTENSISKTLGICNKEKEWWDMNEEKIWEQLNKPQILQSTDSATIQQIIFMRNKQTFKNKNVLSGIGVRMGTYIVDSYMKNNKSKDIKKLLYEDDYKKIIRESNYK